MPGHAIAASSVDVAQAAVSYRRHLFCSTSRILDGNGVEVNHIK
jgi:hypothetical protein